jgi:hypothetical protein
MSNLRKPRFHDEECFGLAIRSNPKIREISQEDAQDKDALSCRGLMQSAEDHFAKQNVKAAVDDIVAAYESLAKDKARLAKLRNLVLRDLSTSNGWQGAPHPQALRLRRLTPSLHSRSPH